MVRVLVAVLVLCGSSLGRGFGNLHMVLHTCFYLFRPINLPDNVSLFVRWVKTVVFVLLAFGFIPTILLYLSHYTIFSNISKG